MEAAEQTSGNNSLLKRIAKKLFSGDQISQALSPQPQFEVVTSPPPLPDKPQIKESGKQARKARKAAYLEAKTGSKQEVLSSQVRDEPLAVQVQEKTQGLPSGFKEVKRSEQALIITQEDLPWMDQDQPSHKASLVEITLAGTGQRFFYGSAILGKELKDAAFKLDKHRSGIANNMLYSHLPGFVSTGNDPRIKLVDHLITQRPIYNIFNLGGQRIYFMRFDELQGIPVIIRIVCDKNMEGKVLSVITDQPHKAIKQSGKL